MRSSLPLSVLALSFATLSAQTWNLETLNTNPSPRRAGAMAFDASLPVANRVVMYGGLISSPSQALSETWLLANNWQLVTTSTAPPRWGHRLVADTANNRVITFGGRSPTVTSLANDTMAFNGTNWVTLQTTVRPSARFLYGMAYDSARNVVVLFGGRNNTTPLNDTWEFNGTNWTQVVTTNKPAPREEMGMVYDAERGETLLFGGCNETTNTFYGDTWSYNGTDWTLLYPDNCPGCPSRRIRAAMVYDSVRRRTVLFGGYQEQMVGTPPMPERSVAQDTWEFQGVWADLGTTAPAPANATETYHAYNPGRQETVLFGGFGTSFSNATWTYEGPSDGVFSLYGNECASFSDIDANVPTLGTPLDLTFDNLNGNLGVVVVLGLSDTVFNGLPLPLDLGVIGLAGCNLLASADFIDLSLDLGATGSTTFSVPLPNNPALLFESLYAQGITLGPTLGFIGTSRGGRALLGN